MYSNFQNLSKSGPLFVGMYENSNYQPNVAVFMSTSAYPTIKINFIIMQEYLGVVEQKINQDFSKIPKFSNPIKMHLKEQIGEGFQLTSYVGRDFPKGSALIFKELECLKQSRPIWVFRRGSQWSKGVFRMILGLLGFLFTHCLVKLFERYSDHQDSIVRTFFGPLGWYHSDIFRIIHTFLEKKKYVPTFFENFEISLLITSLNNITKYSKTLARASTIQRPHDLDFLYF